MYLFFCTFLGKIKKKRKNKKKKQEKCIILMYCLYESINEHKSQCRYRLLRTCVSYVLRPKTKESVKN